jgi:hypothetical protein
MMSNPDKEKCSSDDTIENIDVITPCQEMKATLQQLVSKTLRQEFQWADVPVYLQDNREMVLDAIRLGTVNWHELPPKWKNDGEVTCTVLTKQRLVFRGRSIVDLA